MKHTVCYNCKKKNCKNILTCNHCKKTFYCSKKCRIEYWDNCHSDKCIIKLDNPIQLISDYGKYIGQIQFLQKGLSSKVVKITPPCHICKSEMVVFGDNGFKVYDKDNKDKLIGHLCSKSCHNRATVQNNPLMSISTLQPIYVGTKEHKEMVANSLIVLEKFAKNKYCHFSEFYYALNKYTVNNNWLEAIKWFKKPLRRRSFEATKQFKSSNQYVSLVRVRCDCCIYIVDHICMTPTKEFTLKRAKEARKYVHLHKSLVERLEKLKGGENDAISSKKLMAGSMSRLTVLMYKFSPYYEYFMKFFKENKIKGTDTCKTGKDVAALFCKNLDNDKVKLMYCKTLLSSNILDKFGYDYKHIVEDGDVIMSNEQIAIRYLEEMKDRSKEANQYLKIVQKSHVKN